MHDCPITSREARRGDQHAAQEYSHIKPVADDGKRCSSYPYRALSGSEASQFSSLICQKHTHFLWDWSVNFAGLDGPWGQISMSVNRRKKGERGQ